MWARGALCEPVTAPAINIDLRNLTEDIHFSYQLMAYLYDQILQVNLVQCNDHES